MLGLKCHFQMTTVPLINTNAVPTGYKFCIHQINTGKQRKIQQNNPKKDTGRQRKIHQNNPNDLTSNVPEAKLAGWMRWNFFSSLSSKQSKKHQIFSFKTHIPIKSIIITLQYNFVLYFTLKTPDNKVIAAFIVKVHNYIQVNKNKRETHFLKLATW